MSIFDHRKRKNVQTNKEDASRMSNAFAPLKSQPNNQEEIAREFPTNDQTSRMSNAFVAGKSHSKSQEEIAKEFPTSTSKGQTFKHDNGAN